MPTQDDVRRIATSLPRGDRGGRPIRVPSARQGLHVGLAGSPGVRAAARAQPGRPGGRVDGELEKESLIGMDPDVFFTEPHYRGYPAVLVRLAAIDISLLKALLVRAWRIQAPKRLAATLER